MNETEAGLPQAWLDLRRLAARSDRVLNEEVYRAAWGVFLSLYAAGEATPGAWTREYTRAEIEYLLVVGGLGQPAGLGQGLHAAYDRAVNAYSEFGNWFKPAVLDGEPVLLAARWLCHLAGLRHATVEIFIDPPGLDGFTLAQLRGLDKVDMPGALDLPCAGHVDGLDTIEESLRKELGEELNLSPEDLEDLRVVARYTGLARDPARLFLNEEYCVLYRARLKTTSAARIRFSDGEVAGLGVFSVAELRELVRRFPERAARGLADSLPYYPIDCTRSASTL
jgi:8-oxo-dGTP pyrophosphatase MutT (NUDIX family)